MKYYTQISLILFLNAIKFELNDANISYVRSVNARSGRVRKYREGAIRLVGGRRQNEGNVEIYHVGKWGSICDDEWDLIEANIVCKSLRYESGAERATGNSEFGRGRKLIWMDSVFCAGNESSLNQCPFDGWNVHDCDANEAAGVVCRESRINDNEIDVNLNDA
ncbi:lysyl oxidase 2-like protein, partial [Leptotrombidium deliense]